jgi:hypothetical protein
MVPRNHKILGDAFANLTVSIINNAADEVLDRLLAGRLARYRTLGRAVGRGERRAMAPDSEVNDHNRDGCTSGGAPA